MTRSLPERRSPYSWRWLIADMQWAGARVLDPQGRAYEPLGSAYRMHVRWDGHDVFPDAAMMASDSLLVRWGEDESGRPAFGGPLGREEFVALDRFGPPGCLAQGSVELLAQRQVVRRYDRPRPADVEDD